MQVAVWVCDDCYHGPTLCTPTTVVRRCMICRQMKTNVDTTYSKWLRGDNCPRCRVPLEVQIQKDFKKWWACPKCDYRRRVPLLNEEEQNE